MVYLQWKKSLCIEGKTKYFNASVFIDDLSKSREYSVMLEIDDDMFVSHFLHDNRYYRV